MFENMSYIPGFIDTYDHELSQIEAASERLAARIERETAKLTRSDGSRVYADQEHQEREQAILEAAGAEFGQSAARYAAKAESDATDIQKQLALLERDPFDSLKPEEQQRASLQREFVSEDCERLPAHQLVPIIRAAMAAQDLPTLYLFNRYIPQRIEARRGQTGAQADVELLPVSRELAAAFGADDRAQKRRDLAAKLRAATSFPIAVSTARSKADGSDARALAGYRQHMMARF